MLLHADGGGLTTVRANELRQTEGAQRNCPLVPTRLHTPNEYAAGTPRRSCRCGRELVAAGVCEFTNIVVPDSLPKHARRSPACGVEVDASGEQHTKTRRALEFFSNRLR